MPINSEQMRNQRYACRLLCRNAFAKPRSGFVVTVASPLFALPAWLRCTHNIYNPFTTRQHTMKAIAQFQESNTARRFKKYLRSAQRTFRPTKSTEEKETRQAMTTLREEGWIEDSSEFDRLDVDDKQMTVLLVALSRMTSASSSFFATSNR